MGKTSEIPPVGAGHTIPQTSYHHPKQRWQQPDHKKKTDPDPSITNIQDNDPPVSGDNPEGVDRYV